MRRRGAALLMTLVVLAVLTVVVAAAAQTQHVWVRAQLNRNERDLAERTALSGVQRALASLADADPARLTQQDEWFTLGENGATAYQIAGGNVRMQIRDAGSLVNLNTAGEDQLARMGLQTDAVDALLDWRSEGQEPRPQGAKDEYYNNLEQPYNAALAPLRTVDEVLMVRYFTAGVLYNAPETSSSTPLVTGEADEQPSLYELSTVDSVAPNQNPDGEDKLNVNTATQQQMTQRGVDAQVAQAIIQRRNQQGTFQNMGEVLRVEAITTDNAGPVLDQLTVGTETVVRGRINLNTAPEEVLLTIPALPQDAARAIVNRAGDFEGIGEIAELAGITTENLPDLADVFTVGGSSFVVRAVGTYGQTTVALEVVVQLEEGLPVVRKINRYPRQDYLTQWGWEEESTSEVELVQS